MKENSIIIVSIDERVAQALNELRMKFGDLYDIKKVTVSEMMRRTGLPRGKLRELKKNDFQPKPHGNTGKKREHTVLEGHDGKLNTLLAQGITNSDVLLSRIREDGYKGSLTTVKNYISANRNLVPAIRVTTAIPRGNRGRRYSTEEGEMFQMDWGFLKVENTLGEEYKVACLVIICHYCGLRYVEFFTNARQENLFIGMIHAFSVMGVPEVVLTDNMASVSNKKDANGFPIFNPNYDIFQKAIGFRTKLCKPYHPFTKGAAERLVKYVKGNFAAGRRFDNLNDLNSQALKWCYDKNSKLQKGKHVIPMNVHCDEESFKALPDGSVLFDYLAPARDISWDGFITYENRRYGVPLSYTKKTVRVERCKSELYIYDDVTHELVQTHEVDWSGHDHCCQGQWAEPEQPEEHETQAITTTISQESAPKALSRYEFDMEEN